MEEKERPRHVVDMANIGTGVGRTVKEEDAAGERMSL